MQGKSRYSTFFFGLSFILVLYAFYLILKPFLISIILAITVVCLFHPQYSRLNRALGKNWPGFSALIMCTIMTLLIILPLVIFVMALFNEMNSAYIDFRMKLASGELATSGIEVPAILAEVWAQIQQYLGIEDMNLALAFSTLIDRSATYLLDHYSAILGGLGAVVLRFFIMIFSMFFFFRDGESLLNEVKRLIPLNPHYENMLLFKLRDVIYATFFGIFATGLCQGMAAAVIFYLLGIRNPILWGTATAFFALVPVVGTAAVWVPLAIYLMLTGSLLKGIILLVLGGTVIGLVDNFVRPIIIEGRSGGMHMLLVFFALLGGLILFGPAGLVIGPLIVALLITFLEIYKIEFEEALSDDDGRETGPIVQS